MKVYNNQVIINGEVYTNIIKADNYTEALKIQKLRKKQSKNTFKGRLTKAN
jgi:hypothetical protein